MGHRLSSVFASRHGLTLTLAGAVTVAVAVPLAVPAAASPSASGVVSATVLLAGAGDVSALATSSVLPRVARLARLQAAAPSRAAQGDLAAAVRALRLTIDGQTPWSLVVHGAASAVDELATMPGVASVLRDGGERPSPAVAQPLQGSDFRTAYRAAAPSADAKPMVATIQFAGWDSSELAGYAHARGLNPLDPGQFTAVSVGKASTTAWSTNSGEVALDQESIYDTAPYATQRAYFADPSLAGLVAALNTVAVDAASQPALVALSISWTWCSSTLAYDDVLAVHAALANVVAAGVTVFASSGDDGAYCGSGGTKDVAYPAADPYVLAVGGTHLTMSPSTAETGWAKSGGGVSHFPMPSWQQALGVGTRELPDLAADADPETGFYGWHDKHDGTGAGNQQYGGTSLASAIAAASYADELASRGALDGGLGDLHSSLYSAPATYFRDVTAGSNGSYTAKTGYDMVTGLGAPLWQPLIDRLLTQPVISVPATVHTRVVQVHVSAPAGQTFLAWRTGSGTPPTSCGTSAGQPAEPADVLVGADGTFTIWAQGYVGADRCFTVSTSAVVDTGHPAPAPTSAPVTGAPVTGAPATGVPTPNPVMSGPPAIVSTDVTPPTTAVGAHQTSLAASAIAFTWRASDSSGLSAVSATVYRDGRPVSTRSVAASGTLKVVGDAGHAYRMGLVATDRAGNIGGSASGTVRLPYDDRSFTAKGWTRSASRTSLGGSYLKAGKAGATATVTLRGSSFRLLTATGPANGLLAVYIDGRHVRDLSLYSRAGRANVVVSLAHFGKAGKHRITLLVKGKRAPHGRGTLVDLDGLLAT